MKNIKLISFFFLSLLLGYTACVDQDFDEPPVTGLPEEVKPVANATIADILALHSIGSPATEITSDAIIEGVVIGNDVSGNIYKQLFIQDATGGIQIRLDVNELYNDYPLGRQVWIKCQGLFIGDYNGTPQMGINANADRVPESLVSTYVVTGERDQTIPLTTKTINDLGFNDINTLIQLENVQFLSSEVGDTYADAVNQSTQNRELEDCNGNNIILRSSGFSDFAGATIPDGGGTLTAIYAVFGNTKQLTIRQLSDVALDGARCGTGGGGGEIPTPNASLADVLAIHTIGDAASQITSDLIVEAVVAADDESGNFYKNIIVQDGTGGLQIRMNDTGLNATYPIGRKVYIKTMGLYIGDYNGTPQLSLNADGDGIEPSNISSYVVAGDLGQTVTSTIKTIDALTTADLNTLIELSNVQFADSEQGAIYAESDVSGTNRTLEDCDGNSIIVRTSRFADFAEETLAAGNGSLKAIYTIYQGTNQLVLRNTVDVNLTGTRCDGGSGGGGGGGGSDMVNEDFSGLGNNDNIMLDGWVNFQEEGDRVWIAKEFSGNVYAQMSSYNADAASNKAWLITPGIDLSEASSISFETAQAFYAHDGLTVWISTDFDGSDVLGATWNTLPCTIAGSSDPNHEWIPSGTIDLSGFSGTAYVAFKYEGTAAANTTSYRVDNVVVE